MQLVVAEEATAAIRTFNYELCSFYSNVEKELSVHLARKHAKYSEIEADDSYCEVADDVIDKEIDEEQEQLMRKAMTVILQKLQTR